MHQSAMLPLILILAFTFLGPGRAEAQACTCCDCTISTASCVGCGEGDSPFCMTECDDADPDSCTLTGKPCLQSAAAPVVTGVDGSAIVLVDRTESLLPLWERDGDANTRRVLRDQTFLRSCEGVILARRYSAAGAARIRLLTRMIEL